MPADTKDPTGLQLVDPVLTNFAVRYRPDGFIADQLVTIMNVTQDKGLYPVWNADDLFRDDVESVVGDRAETPEIDLGYSTSPYILTPRRLKVTISDEERGQAHSALKFEEVKTQFLLNRFALQRERRLAAALKKTTSGGQLTLGGGVSTKWDASSGATILKDIKAARKAVRDATGQLPNTMALDWEVAYAMALDSEILSIIKETPEAMQIIVGGDRVLPKTIHGMNVVIASAQVNTAKKGAASQNRTTVWGDSVRLLKVGEDDTWGLPSTVYGLRGLVGTRRPAAGGSDGGRVPGHVLVDRWTTPDPPVDHIRAWDKTQDLFAAADIGYEIQDVLT